jgi:hypothetical protein
MTAPTTRWQVLVSVSAFPSLDLALNRPRVGDDAAPTGRLFQRQPTGHLPSTRRDHD